MPNRQGRFNLYSDTSKFAAGSTLYQNSGWQAEINFHMQVKDSQKQLVVTQ